MARPKTRTPDEIRAYRTEWKRRRRIAQQTAPGYLNRSDRQRGERNKKAKLTWKLVRVIRKRAEQGITQRAIAEEFGLAQSTINSVIQQKTWIK